MKHGHFIHDPLILMSTDHALIVYHSFWHGGAGLYEEIINREKIEGEGPIKSNYRTATSRGISTDKDQRAEEGQRRVGETTARSFVRHVGIPKYTADDRYTDGGSIFSDLVIAVR